MKDLTSWTPNVSTVIAMLILIGCEYRVEGANFAGIAAHIRGVQASIKTWSTQNLPVISQMQRALFWQDLISCLAIGTPRLLSHNHHENFLSLRDTGCLDVCVVPSGFLPVIHLWPSEFAVALEDLNALCWFADAKKTTKQTSSETLPQVLLMAELDDEGFPVNNSQANLESRLVDLLSESRRTLALYDPIYEACIFAAYLCTYKLSKGAWEGCFVPEICALRVIRYVAESMFSPRPNESPGLLLWLLFVGGGLSERGDIRARAVAVAQSVCGVFFEGLYRNWVLLKRELKSFIWSEYAMERNFIQVWEELNSAIHKASGALVPRVEVPSSSTESGRLGFLVP